MVLIRKEKMRTILLPTDFSENADKALDYTIELAKKERAKIVLLHAFRVNYTQPYNYLAYDIVTTTTENAKKESDRLLKSRGLKIDHAGGVAWEYISRENFVVDAILDVIKEKDIDLVVMGTEGAHGIKEALMGSTTARIIERSPCPVIAVPSHTDIKDIKKITYATDYHRSDLSFVMKLMELARPYNAQINFLHIAPAEREGSDELMKMFVREVNRKTWYNNLSYKLIFGRNVAKELEDYIKRESPDLMVMSTRKRDLLERLFDRSITKRLAFHTHIPLMAFHYKKETVNAF